MRECTLDTCGRSSGKFIQCRENWSLLEVWAHCDVLLSCNTLLWSIKSAPIIICKRRRENRAVWQAEPPGSPPTTFQHPPITLSCHSPTSCQDELPLLSHSYFLAPSCHWYQLPGPSQPNQQTAQIDISCRALYRCS